MMGHLVLISRFGDTVQLGEYTLALAIISPLIVFVWMQQRLFISGDAGDDIDISDYFAFRTVGIVLASIVSILIAVGSGAGEYIGVFIGILMYKLIDSYSDIISGVFLKRNMIVSIPYYQALRSMFRFSGFAIPYYIHGSLAEALVVGASASACVLVFEFRRMNTVERSHSIRSWFAPGWLRRILDILKSTYNLGLVELAYSVQSNTTRYIFAYYYGEMLVGVYSSMIYFMRPIVLAANSVFQLAAPALSRACYVGSARDLRVVLGLLVGVVLAFSVISHVIFARYSDYMVSMVYGEQIGMYSFMLPIIAINNYFSLPAAILSYFGVICKRFRHQPMLIVIVILSNLIFSYLLQIKYGQLGVISGWIASSAVLLLGHMIYSYGLLWRKGDLDSSGA